MSDQSWSKLHDRYTKQDWINKPSFFAETAAEYFPKAAKILELGAGQGQDSRYFADKGHTVVSTDLEQTALDKNIEKLTAQQTEFVSTQKVDLREELPFGSESFDVVYAHLSIHYFDRDHTIRIMDEVGRVLKPGGVFAFFVNSTSDPEYGKWPEIESDYFDVEGTSKRYFSMESARDYTQYNFDTVLLDNHGETYKDSAKGVHNLIRYIGTKKIVKRRWNTAVPYVGAIIERHNNGHTEILLQTRWQPHGDPVYSGTLEFPAGRMDNLYEDVYEALGREIKEETGLTLKGISNDQRSKSVSTGRDDKIIGFQPYYCTQQLKNGQPWIGFVFRCEVEPGEPSGSASETKDPQWIRVEKLRKMVAENPNQFFGLELPALQYYLDQTK